MAARFDPANPTTRPTVLLPRFDNMPKALTALPRWVLWNYEPVNGRWSKIPKQPNGRNASSTNQSTWSSFEDVRAAYDSEKHSGIGICLGAPFTVDGVERYIVGVDFDDCITDQQFAPFVKEAISDLRTYTEISPSGAGVRMFLLHDRLIKASKLTVDGASREIYSSGRYLTVTGHGKGQVRYVA